MALARAMEPDATLRRMPESVGLRSVCFGGMSTPETPPDLPPTPSANANAPASAPGGAPVTAVAAAAAPKAAQPRNPLHGVTLEAMVVALADYFGWHGLGQRIPIRCFQIDPSVGSSLKFLRKTPWAREKVEGLYLFMLRDQKRNGEG